MVAEQTASAIVRCKDKALTVEETFRSLRDQTVPVELVVVDSGSVDGTLEIARRYCDELVTMPPEQFTFGGALNRGAERASGDVVFALSAHCVAPHPQWVEWTLDGYRSPKVAATITESSGPDGALLPAPVAVSAGTLARQPGWGYSNHAGAWRRSVWEEHPFDPSLRSCEDKEWMWRVLDAGWEMIADPRLAVVDSHRRDEGLRKLWRRVYLERATLSALFDLPLPSAPDLVQQWWSSFPYPSRYPNWMRRLSPARTTELVAGWLGEREGASHPPPRIRV